MCSIKAALGKVVILAALCITAGNGTRREASLPEGDPGTLPSGTSTPMPCYPVNPDTGQVSPDMSPDTGKLRRLLNQDVTPGAVVPFLILGPMTSGKSELLIMAMRNLRDRGIIYILGLPEVVGSTLIGTRSTQVPVRQHTIDFVIGRPDWEETYQGLLNNGTGVVVVMIDEVQFLIEEHVWALNEIAQRIAREHGIEIRIVFAGLAHDSDRREWSVIATIRTLPNCEESTLWAVCSTCGGQASETGRYDSETGEGLRDQPQIVLDGTSCVVYAPVCGGCYGRSLSPRQLSLLLRGVHPRLVAKLGRELPIEFEFGTAPHR